jgi:hypothetical protein
MRGNNSPFFTILMGGFVWWELKLVVRWIDLGTSHIGQRRQTIAREVVYSPPIQGSLQGWLKGNGGNLMFKGVGAK